MLRSDKDEGEIVRKSCALESRSMTCMVPPQTGHMHSESMESAADEAALSVRCAK